MSKLDEYRAEIDNIDKELVALFEKRMNVVLNVARYKKENNLNVLQNGREEEVLNKAVDNLVNKDYSNEVRDFLNDIMEISRGLQNRKINEANSKSKENIQSGELDYSAKVGFQGVKGAFSETATLTIFNNQSTNTSYKTFEDVFKAIDKGEIKYGVLPIENSSTGSIAEVLDLLNKYNFYIVAEQCIRVKQNLVGIKGTKLEDIKEVYSHPQGLSQSKEFLKGHDWNLIPYSNTAASAKLISETHDKTKVAIASERAAQIYGLDILEEEINTAEDNYTRFVVISKDMTVSDDSDKVSLVFSLEDKAGTLYRLLSYFAENNINMVKIESRPMKNSSWKYFLYVDFQGKINSEDSKKALEYVERESSYFKILGAYKNKLNS